MTTNINNTNGTSKYAAYMADICPERAGASYRTELQAVQNCHGRCIIDRARTDLAELLDRLPCDLEWLIIDGTNILPEYAVTYLMGTYTPKNYQVGKYSRQLYKELSLMGRYYGIEPEDYPRIATYITHHYDEWIEEIRRYFFDDDE